jgi:hypothetical protein
MSAAVITRDFLDWLATRGMAESDSPPVLWAQIVLYDREREIGMWPSEDTE